MALSSPRTQSLSLETPTGCPDPDGHRDGEQWPKTSETAVDLEAGHSMDVILVGSSEVSSPASPLQGRGLMVHEVTVNQRNIEDFCLCCGSLQVHTQHPLFEGGICAPCKDKFLEALFLYDDDGYLSCCSICGSGETLLICENPDCTRCYCQECMDTLVGPGTWARELTSSSWVCFLCLPFARHGLLRRRRKWRCQLKAFHDLEAENPVEIYKTLPAYKREPLRALCLFGDIKQELTSLGFLEPGVGAGRLMRLEDVSDVVRRDVEKWGPFDLVYGSTPPLGRALDRSPGWYLFQFHRLLQYARPRPGSPQPFFWMFVDNRQLTEEDQAIATRFLEVEPATLQGAQSAVHVWSNIPAVKRHVTPTPSAVGEPFLRAGGARRGRLPTSAIIKNCFLPLKEYFKCFSQNTLPL